MLEVKTPENKLLIQMTSWRVMVVAVDGEELGFFLFSSHSYL